MTETLNKPSKIIKNCEKISKISIYLLVFLLPLFFLPWTANIIDFNKQALLIVLVFISLFAWLLKILISGNFSLDFSWVNLPIIFLFLAMVFSTIFSSFRYGSFWGWPSVVSESLLTLLGFVLFYFLVINIFEKRGIFYLLALLTISGILAMLYGIIQLFGKFIIPFDFAKTSFFNTLGSMNSLALFAAVLLPLIITFLIAGNKKYLKIISFIGAIISLVLLILINFSIAWWIVMLVSVLIITLGTQKREFFDSRWVILPMFFLALALFFTFFKFQIPGVPSQSVEVSLNQKATFEISSKSLKENTIFGSGPGTFVYNFSKYRETSFNQNPFWNIRFENGGSKVLTLLATTGILGTLSFIALLFLFIIYGLKSLFAKKIIKVKVKSSHIASEESLVKTEKGLDEGFIWNMGFGVFISFIALSFVFFLYYSGLSLDFVYFLLMAAFVSFSSMAKKEFFLKPSSVINFGFTFIFTVFFIFSLGILIFGGQRYVAELNYIKGVRAWQGGEIENSMNYIEKAVRINQKSDLYLRELSQVYLQNINTVAVRTDLAQEEINRRVQILINNAVNSAKLAVEANPINVSNWSVRGFIYQGLIGVVGGTSEWSIKSYEEAIKLEPANPYFPTQIGISLLKEANSLPEDKKAEKEGIVLRAQEQFKKAIELKSDYASAHFQSAVIYQMQGKQEEMVVELEKTKDAAPFDVGLAFQLGLVYYQNKEYGKAREELERAVIMNPEYSNALYYLGLVYDKLGEKDKAIKIFEKVADLNPDNAEAKKILDNLRTGKDALEGIVGQVPPVVPIEEEHPEIEEKTEE